MELEELESPASSRRNKEADPMIEEGSSSPGHAASLCCDHCFGFRRRPGRARPSSSSSFWERIGSSHFDHRWWAPGLRVLKKLREWSEIVAGPRWKTFIRRFSRSRSIGAVGGAAHDRYSHGRFNYDPMSYALNFDEGPGHDPHHLDDEDYFRRYRNFSVRHAPIPGGGSSAAGHAAGKGKDAMAAAVAVARQSP